MSVALGMTMSILGYNAWMFGNAVKDVSAEQAGFRVKDNTNAFDRLAGHVVVARHGMGGLVKIEMPELPWGSFAEFGMGTQFDDERECASLGDIAEKFNDVSAVLMANFPQVSDDVLASPSPFPIPGEGQTMQDLLAFLTMHETYHIGQLGLLKKCMSGASIMA